MMNQSQKLLYFETHQNNPRFDWMVLVHGAGGSIATWKRQISDFSQHYNLLLIELPGHGKHANNPHPVQNYTFKWMANKIWQVIDHLKIPSIHLVGVSVGAIICMKMNQLRPQNTLSVVLAGAIVKLNTKLKILASMSLGIAKVIGFPRFYKMSARIMMPRRNHKKSRDVFIRESQVIPLEEFRKLTNMYHNLDQVLKSLFSFKSTIPHYLVMGDQDHLFLNPAKEYAKTHQNSEINIFENCGHVVSIEQAKRFNQSCIQFLQKIGARIKP